ncbi:unnamed protein product, partial [Prorocentrum cordatum]
ATKLKSGDMSQKAMIAMVCKRAHAIGMYTLSEGSKGQLAAVVSSQLTGVTNDMWYDILVQVKLKLATMKARDWKHRTIWEYDSPDSLESESWYYTAYPEGDPPRGQDWYIDEPDFVRLSSRLMKGGKHAAKQVRDDRPAPPPPTAPPPAIGDFGAYKSMYGAMNAYHMYAHPGTPAPLGDLSDEEAALRKTVRNRKEAVALNKRAAAAGGDADGVEGADDDGDELADEEGGPPKKVMKGAPPKKAMKVAMRRPSAKPKPLPKAPMTGAPKVEYRAGYILTQPDKSQYRAVLGRSDRRIRWGTGSTRQEAFTKAMKCIDERS